MLTAYPFDAQATVAIPGVAINRAVKFATHFMDRLGEVLYCHAKSLKHLKHHNATLSRNQGCFLVFT